MKKINYHLPKENCVKVMRASVCFRSAWYREFVTQLIGPVKYRQIMIWAIDNNREIHAKHLGKIVWGYEGLRLFPLHLKVIKGDCRVFDWTCHGQVNLLWSVFFGLSFLVCLFWCVFFDCIFCLFLFVFFVCLFC